MSRCRRRNGKGGLAMPHALLVEDELTFRRIVTLNLVRKGYSVAEADTVEMAFDMLLAAREAGLSFDVIVLETHLRERPGWDLLRMARVYDATSGERALAAIPVIVISPLPVAAGWLSDYAPCAALVKPFPIGALLDRITAARRQASVPA